MSSSEVQAIAADSMIRHRQQFEKDEGAVSNRGAVWIFQYRWRHLDPAAKLLAEKTPPAITSVARYRAVGR